jgi:hypothetical protein
MLAETIPEIGKSVFPDRFSLSPRIFTQTRPSPIRMTAVAQPLPCTADFSRMRRSLLIRLKNWDDHRGWREFMDKYGRLAAREIELLSEGK